MRSSGTPALCTSLTQRLKVVTARSTYGRGTVARK